MGDMSPNFNRSEFACKCGCGLDGIDPMFVWSLQHSRERVGIPYTIHSGCRCPAHNKAEGGAETSAHVPRNDYPRVKCSDIGCNNMFDRKKILADVCTRFRHIGIHAKFIHVDDDPAKPDGVFTY